MSDAIGEFIDGGTGAISSTDTGAFTDFIEPDRSADGNGKPAEPVGGPEKIHGFETIDPNGIRFDSGARTDAGGIRYTKSGKPDRRTRAARNGGIGSTEKDGEISPNLDKLSLTEILISAHEGIAALCREEYILLERKEAEKLSASLTKVSRLYGKTFDPKKVAITELIIVAGGIYLPRAMAIWGKYSMPKQVEDGPQKVVQMPQSQTPINLQSAVPKGAKDPTGETPGISPSQLWWEPAAVDVMPGI